jgi:hypothetical protein
MPDETTEIAENNVSVKTAVIVSDGTVDTTLLGTANIVVMTISSSQPADPFPEGTNIRTIPPYMGAFFKAWETLSRE